MFTLDQIENINRQYRFKYNMATKESILIESATSKPITDESEAVKIKTGLLLFQMLKKKSNVHGKFTDEQFLQDLQRQVADLIKNKQYSFNLGTTKAKTAVDALIVAYNTNQITPVLKSCYKDLFESVANDSNLTIENIEIIQKPNGVGQEVKVSSKPLEVQIEQESKPKTRLPSTEAQKQNRANYIDKLIETFWENASDKHKMLVNRDQFKFVSKIKEHVNNGEAIPAIPSEKILIGILIALKSNGEDYYLDCFLSDAGVNKMLLKMKKENYIQTMREEAKAREQAKPKTEEQVVEESEQNVSPKDISIDKQSLKTAKDAEEDLLFGALRDMMKEHIGGLQEFDSTKFDQIEPELIEKINKMFRFLAGKSQMTCINPNTNQEESLKQILRDAVLKKSEIQIDALIKANEKNVKVVNCLETFKLVQSACDQYILTDMISAIANNDSLKQIAKTLNTDKSANDYRQALEDALKYGYGQDLLKQMYQSSENYRKYMSKDFLSSLTIASNNMKVAKEKERQGFSLADIFEKGI